MTTFNSYEDFISEYSIDFWFSKHPGKKLRRWDSLSGDSQYSEMEYQCEDEDDLNHFVQAVESGQEVDKIFTMDAYKIDRDTLKIKVVWCLYLP